MPKQKQKTRKTAAKRFTITKTGKVRRSHANTTHNARKDTSSAKHRKARDQDVYKAFAKKIKKLINN